MTITEKGYHKPDATYRVECRGPCFRYFWHRKGILLIHESQGFTRAQSLYVARSHESLKGQNHDLLITGVRPPSIPSHSVRARNETPIEDESNLEETLPPDESNNDSTIFQF